MPTIGLKNCLLSHLQTKLDPTTGIPLSSSAANHELWWKNIPDFENFHSSKQPDLSQDSPKDPCSCSRRRTSKHRPQRVVHVVHHTGSCKNRYGYIYYIYIEIYYQSSIRESTCSSTTLHQDLLPLCLSILPGGCSGWSTFRFNRYWALLNYDTKVTPCRACTMFFKNYWILLFFLYLLLLSLLFFLLLVELETHDIAS